MQPFRVVTGRAVVLDRDDVDTDQIVPAEHLKRVSRAGFGDCLFSSWRERDPAFVLNRAEARGAVFLIAGRNFGCGSSREHAVWALEDWGFRAVIAQSFADIFRTNCTKVGLLPVTLDGSAVGELSRAVRREPRTELTVDLEGQTVTAPGLRAGFDIEGHTKDRLLHGLDDIGATLRVDREIETAEGARSDWLPALH